MSEPGLPPFESIIAGLTARPLARCVVVAPHSVEAIAAVAQVVAEGAVLDLTGDRARIKNLLAEAEVDVSAVRIHDSGDSDTAVDRAVDLIRTGDAEFVVKGSIPTADLLGGLLRQRLPGRSACASHIYVMQLEQFGGRTVLLTDAGVNIEPDLATKAAIVENALQLYSVLSSARPRLAVLSAIEKVSTRIPATLDAAELRLMAERGKLGAVDVDGPMPLDAALFPESAVNKNLAGEVAGQADILLAPDLNSGNLLAKALVGHHAPAMGVVLGAGVPVALPSRGDTVATRRHSFYLASHLTRSAATSPNGCDRE
ncbi:phosphate acyltransferase [Saccharopolyspora spinosa]|uniref:Phosphate acetyltransferase n=1 Tax=Saccharopolyspora spinosa TaxID=60894 RepID=A0A2N3Y3J0_SACSN|nr:phosphate acyltransferase [Saccharopolyspora spinosa]PKW17472.1 phosphate acetyltransferase [Saccharopolyspora spinosa]